MKSPFSIEESLKFGWEKTRAHSMLLFQIILTLFALQVAYAIVGRVLAYTLMGTFRFSCAHYRRARGRRGLHARYA